MATTIDAAHRRSLAAGSRRLLALRGDGYLVAPVRAGEAAAFEAFYDRYAGVLLSFCRHMLGDAAEAEDAVQQVFVSAHGALLRDDRAVDPKPWLYAIARNRCLSVLRARPERAPEPVDELPQLSGLQEQVQNRQDLRELVGDLALLPERQRAALLLTELQDMSQAEAAEILECEVSQVKGLVFRARAGLIERREARATRCEEIRAELSIARSGALRKGRLRHHLAGCPGCEAYLAEVRRQRAKMALILPVLPGTGLKRGVLAAVGLGGGGGATGAGTLAVLGGGSVAGTLAKVAAIGALVGGASVTGHQVLDHGDPRPAKPPVIERVAPTTSRPAAADAAPATPATVDGTVTRKPGHRVHRTKPSDGVGRRNDGRASRARGRRSKPGRSESGTSARGTAPPGLTGDRGRSRRASGVPPGHATGRQGVAMRRSPRANPPPAPSAAARPKRARGKPRQPD